MEGESKAQRGKMTWGHTGSKGRSWDLKPGCLAPHSYSVLPLVKYTNDIQSVALE